MKTMIRLAGSMALSTALAFAASAADGPTPLTLELWPGAVPGETKSVGEEQLKKKAGTEAITSITNVSKPTLTVSRPPADKNTGVAIVVFPGGGYNNLAWEHEGTMVESWLNSIGVTSVLVKYRVPRRPETPKNEPPVSALMDAQRAISLARSHASEWGIDPKKIGVLGFSAGGHLAAWASTNPDKRAHFPIDGADQISCRPDFAVLIYPGGIMKRNSDELAPEIRVGAETPPTFLAVATDDNGPAIGGATYYLALKRAKVPAELHIYNNGGHGFGMRSGDKPANAWPARCVEWMKEQGIWSARTVAESPQPRPKGSVVAHKAIGTFEVKITPQGSPEGGSGVGRMSLDKTFSGDLEGTSKGEMLTAMTEVKGSAGYVAIERVVGKLGGRSGSFAFQHSGTMNRGAPQLTITVVPDSGAGELVGLAGSLGIQIADGKHSYQFDYTLPGSE